MSEKPYAPACDRNRDPILAVLRVQLADSRRVLEVGAGTGQHAVHFAAAMPWLRWQCSDVPANLPGIRLWLDEAGLPNTPSPIALDVRGEWPQDTFDAVFSANTLHIMGWADVQRFFAGVDRVLRRRPGRGHATNGADRVDGGVLVLYGPFNYGGAYTSDSNREFDAWLKARDPQSGIRDFEAVAALARSIGLQLAADVAMPANNRTLVWRRQG